MTTATSNQASDSADAASLLATLQAYGLSS